MEKKVKSKRNMYQNFHTESGFTRTIVQHCLSETIEKEGDHNVRQLRCERAIPPLELSPSLARSVVFVCNPVRNDGELSVEWR